MTDAEPADHDPLLGTRIDGRYSVHREMGRGGMGVVYEGVHDDLGRPVAIKVLNLAWASDPTAVARFLREARTASSFSHPNIVDVTDLGRLPDGRPYLIMPKITGTDLTAMLTESGAQPAKRVAHLLVGVGAALDVIHAKGFVHRDIKPENLMYVVREDGSETVMLLDFGIAAAVMSNEPRLTGQGAIFGTPQFMPPEVCSGGMPDARGDVYSLATVAFELITGVLPFGDDNMMRVLTEKLTTDPPSLSQASGVPFPPALEDVISRGLARDPAQRFAHASEFIGALQAATDDAPVSWRSGVLRPSFRSAAHPVGSYPGDAPVSSRPGARALTPPPPSGFPEGTRAGGSRAVSSAPPFGGDAAAVTQRTPSQPQRPPRRSADASQRPHVPAQAQNDWGRTSEHAEWAERDRTPSGRDGYGSRPRPDARPDSDYTPRPSSRHDDDYTPRPSSRHDDDYTSGQGRARPSAREEEHWASRAAAEDPWGRSPSQQAQQRQDGLGAGLRASERLRHPSSMDRPSGGARVAMLLGVAALLLGLLWYRHNRGLGLDGRDALLPPSAAELAARAESAARAQHADPGVSHAAAEAPARPNLGENPNGSRATANLAPANRSTGTEAQVDVPGSQQAANSNAAAPAAELAAPTGAELAPTPNTDDHAAALTGAAAPNALPSVAVPGAAAIPSAALHPGTPVQAAKPIHPGGAHVPTTAAKSSTPNVPAEPPTPPDEPIANEPTGSPVLKVEEQAPPPAEEVPDLPVRSPESQAAQLAKDASTALLAGEVGHAIELLREATRLDPDQSLAWRTMGLAFERSGDTQAALAAYRQYIRLAPHGPQADMVRERMRTLDQQ